MNLNHFYFDTNSQCNKEDDQSQLSRAEFTVPPSPIATSDLGNIELITPKTDVSSTFYQNAKFYLQTPTMELNCDFFQPMLVQSHPGNKNQNKTTQQHSVSPIKSTSMNSMSSVSKTAAPITPTINNSSTAYLQTPNSARSSSSGPMSGSHFSPSQVVGLGLSVTSNNDSRQFENRYKQSDQTAYGVTHEVPNQFTLNKKSLIENDKQYELVYSDPYTKTRDHDTSIQAIPSSALIANNSPTTIENVSTNSEPSEEEFSNILSSTSNELEVSVCNLFDFDLFGKPLSDIQSNEPNSDDVSVSFISKEPNESSFDLADVVALENEHCQQELMQQDFLTSTVDKKALVKKANKRIPKPHPKKMLRHAKSFNDRSDLMNSAQNSSTLLLNLNPKSQNTSTSPKHEPQFSFSECSSSFPVNGINNWSFVMEHENIDNIKLKKALSSRIDKPTLKRSTSTTFFECNSVQKGNFNGPKVLKDMRSGMALFQVQQSGGK
ncbi:uncharacterized protein PRCAT00003621001 [Priceomyces carsonii]|uniref:uncharacterized protein n=1 Tax=Priceomyces carsonii TaxID=28549 RepID=UPI002ED7B818|nr:unnamed protein product [Priceomyces carsonii]